MSWLNAHKDGLPLHEREVVISVNGIYQIAIFNALEGSFVTKTTPFTVYNIKEHLVYWMEIPVAEH